MVILNSNADVMEIFRNKQRLKLNGKQIGVTSDKTPMQQEYLRNELDNRTKNGETHLTIRYIRGVPKIVTSKN